MVRVHLVTSCDKAQTIVRKILVKDPAAIAVACHRAGPFKQDGITLLSISTGDRDVYVFDVKQNKDLVVDGGLWRLIESDVLIKIWHDCLKDAISLNESFKVVPRKVYDTQIAYAVLMEENKLPSRLISLPDLCEKYGRKTDLKNFKSVNIGDHMFWARRPITKDMLNIASLDVTPLIPLYQCLNRDMNDEDKSVFYDLSKEAIKASIKGQPFCLGIRQDMGAPILRLNSGQQALLDSTVPLSARGTQPKLSPRDKQLHRYEFFSI